jgi:hypothetical protein
MCVRVTTVAVEKQEVLHIISVCLQPYLTSMQSLCDVLYCPLCLVQLYHPFPN